MKKGRMKFRGIYGASDSNGQPGSSAQDANDAGNNSGDNNANEQAGSSVQHANQLPLTPRKRGYCPCGKLTSNCPQCGGSSLCPHGGSQKSTCFDCPNGGFGRCLCAKLKWENGKLKSPVKAECTECKSRKPWSKGSQRSLIANLGERGNLSVTDESGIKEFIELFLGRVVTIENIRTARFWKTMIESDYHAAANALMQMAEIKTDSKQPVQIQVQMDHPQAEQILDEVAEVDDDREHVAGALLGLALVARKTNEEKAANALQVLAAENSNHGDREKAANVLLDLAAANSNDEEAANVLVGMAGESEHEKNVNAVLTLAELLRNHHRLPIERKAEA